MNPQHLLKHQRDRIDAIDDLILRWLNQRIEVGVSIGRLKESSGLSVVDEERERAVISRLREINSGPLSEASIRRIFQTIIEETRQAQIRTQSQSSSQLGASSPK